MLLLWGMLYHLKIYIFDRLDNHFSKGCEVLIDVLGDGEVVES